MDYTERAGLSTVLGVSRKRPFDGHNVHGELWLLSVANRLVAEIRFANLPARLLTLGVAIWQTRLRTTGLMSSQVGGVKGPPLNPTQRNRSVESKRGIAMISRNRALSSQVQFRYTSGPKTRGQWDEPPAP